MSKKDSNIIIRCNEREKALIKELAKEKGLTVTEYIKVKVFGRKLECRVTEKGIREVWNIY